MLTTNCKRHRIMYVVIDAGEVEEFINQMDMLSCKASGAPPPLPPPHTHTNPPSWGGGCAGLRPPPVTSTHIVFLNLPSPDQPTGLHTVRYYPKVMNCQIITCTINIRLLTSYTVIYTVIPHIQWEQCCLRRKAV